ncbi:MULTISPECIES: hypothetical protein [Methylomonas]|uniref:Glycosyltransferase RgtA/B/C/D-like domain-containing protein n=2 Tax=Methylomonas TaxID=416 RepID=A0A126T3T8_9GAMM|nr:MULTISPECIES: hypothetical protein [Methylomonas]AMK76749.1 hypothetical protein JT25_009635 [Methylomonas denitrificans]OAI00011.1 hypothetical protein A1342_18450 [Methylomonas methanica]TCV82757.1 hypothetical protein EDE11_11112 [Methylomonas methanica]
MTIAQRINALLRMLPTKWVFIGGFLIHFGIMYPGFMCYDAVNQILEAREGRFSDWHPPLMAIIWRFTDSIVPGPAGMLLLQLGLVWTGAYLVFQAFFKPYGAKAAAPLLCVLLFLPPLLGISGAILKDMLMWGALFTAFGIVGHINKQSPRFAFLLFVLTILVLWLAILMRHNAFFATIPILSFAIFRLYPKNSLFSLVRAAVSGAALALALFVVTGAINNRLADRHTYPWVANASFDIAGVIKRLEDKGRQQAIFDQLAGTLNSTGSVDPLLKAYTPMYWREIFRTKPPTLELPKNSMESQIHGFASLSDQQRQTLHTLWIQTILAEPVLWVRHRLAVSKYVLGLVPDNSWSPVMMAKDFPSDLERVYGSHPQATKLQEQLETGMTKYAEYWFFQPWPYFVLTICLFFAVVFRQVTANIEVICLTSSAILHELGLVLAAPSPDFRYSHYMVFCSLLSFLLLARPWMTKSA